MVNRYDDYTPAHSIEFALADVRFVNSDHKAYHIATGFSGDSDAISFPDAFEIYNVTRGASGDMHVARTGDRGGPVGLKFLPHSPTAIWLMSRLNRTIHPPPGETPPRDIYHIDITFQSLEQPIVGDINVECRHGILMSGPLGFTLGKGETSNQEFEFEFQDIVVRMPEGGHGITPSLDGAIS